jgi:hypothetical protein
MLIVQNVLHFQIGARLFHHLIRLPCPSKVGPDVFVFPEEATVGHWRAAHKHWQSEGFIPQPREIKQMTTR